MPTLLQLSQSYQNPESVNYRLAYLREQMEEKVFGLGELAYEDQVQLAMLGETIQIGGYIRTELLAAKSIFSHHLNVEKLSSISGNIGEIIAGILKSANGNSYFDLTNNKIKTNNAEITGGTINIDTISELSNIIQLNGGGHTLYLAPGLIDMSYGALTKTQIAPGNVLIGSISLANGEILFFSDSQLTHTNIGTHYISTYTLTADALTVTGSKNRIVKTENFDKVLHYCLESPTPYFMDIGHGVISEDGKCYIGIEEVFGETVDLVSDYHVQLTKYGPGDIWVADKQPAHFVVEGTPGLRFAWEIKAKQKGYSNERLEKYERLEYEEEADYGALGYEYMIEYEKELIA